MAKKKKKNGVLVPLHKGTTAITNWREQMRKDAIDVAAREILVAPRVSFKGGAIAVNGQDVPINATRKRYELPVIITDFTNEKAFYEREYTEGEGQTPVCYAFGDDEAALTPLKINGVKDNTVPLKQNDACATCRHNAFGTSERGDGKRCKDVRRLMVVAASVKATQVPKTEALLASIPPTSLKNWKKYLKGLKELGFTPWGVRTILYTEKWKATFQVKFEPCGADYEPVDNIEDAAVDEDLYKALQAKQSNIREQMFGPYPVISANEAPKKKTKAEKAKASKRAAKVS
jgi:hypothetical protein